MNSWPPSTRPTRLPEGRRLAPLLAAGAHGSLGAADLEMLGVSVVAVDILEVALGPGLARVSDAGGLGRLFG